MIISLKANHKSFKPLLFKNGFNIILADVTEKSTQHDSRNGSGKSTIVEIIQYCLGSRPDKNSIFVSDKLIEWSFTLEIEIKGQVINATRSVAERNRVYIDCAIEHGTIVPFADKNSGTQYYSLKQWNTLLGECLFEIDSYFNTEYKPTFRALISYFARRGMGGFLKPFEYYARQKQIEIQTANSYLLGLDCGFVSDIQEIKDSQSTLSKLQITNAGGIVQQYLGNIGALNSRKAALQSEISVLEKDLANFKIHPQYFDIEKRVNYLTEVIQETVNEYTICQKTISTYSKSISQETSDKEISSKETLIDLYNEVGVFFDEKIMRTFDDVLSFHLQVIKNRRDYLTTEINSLNERVQALKSKIIELDNERAQNMAIIKSHGALDEYVAMTSRLSELQQSLGSIETKIESYINFQKGDSALKIQREQIVSEARTDIMQRENLHKAMSIFHENSKYLYGTQPGNLEVDITPSGYSFDISIERAKSNGVSHMKIFCYDLMLLEHRINLRPDFLIHDSTIFEGVDERQIYKALELAYEKTKNERQYICMMNSDNMPYHLFDEQFMTIVKNSIVCTLTDAREDGGVLGMKI